MFGCLLNHGVVQGSCNGFLTVCCAQPANSQHVSFEGDEPFTVDGINGFRFGDVFHFRGMPVRNKDSYVFCIDKVTHNVDQTGVWTTRKQESY